MVEDDTGKVIEEIEAGKAFFQARIVRLFSFFLWRRQQLPGCFVIRLAACSTSAPHRSHAPSLFSPHQFAPPPRQVYEGAIYMHQSRTYLCTSLDTRAKQARVRPVRAKYYTAVMHQNAVRVVGRVSAYPDRPQPPPPGRHQPARGSTAQCCIAEVETTWQGYVKIWRGTGEVFDEVEQSLPRSVYETIAAWLRVPDAARDAVAALPLAEGQPPRELRAGLHAAAHAVLNALPLFVMCSAADIGTDCDNPLDTRYRPQRILIYDKIAGGSGLCTQAAPIFADLLQAAVELIEACPCAKAEGCPGCVWSLGCSQYNQLLDKEAALAVLRETIKAEDAHRAGKGGKEAEGGGGAGGGFHQPPQQQAPPERE